MIYMWAHCISLHFCTVNHLQVPFTPVLFLCHKFVLLKDVFVFAEYGPAFNLVLSSPLNPSCLWQSPPWWQEDQKAREGGSRGKEESWIEDSRSKTKIGQLSGWSGMSGRKPTWCQLFRKDECHGKWKNLPSLVSITTSWALIYWCGRAQPL